MCGVGNMPCRAIVINDVHLLSDLCVSFCTHRLSGTSKAGKGMELIFCMSLNPPMGRLITYMLLLIHPQ